MVDDNAAKRARKGGQYVAGRGLTSITILCLLVFILALTTALYLYSSSIIIKSTNSSNTNPLNPLTSPYQRNFQGLHRAAFPAPLHNNIQPVTVLTTTGNHLKLQNPTLSGGTAAAAAAAAAAATLSSHGHQLKQDSFSGSIGRVNSNMRKEGNATATTTTKSVRTERYEIRTSLTNSNYEACLHLKNDFGVRVGQSWGRLSQEQTKEWIRRQCDLHFCQPNPLSGRGSFVCVPLEGMGKKGR